MSLQETTRKLLEELVRCESVTPADAGCQQIIAGRLQAAGFAVEHMPFGEVKNLWATVGNDGTGPLVVFAGHTDVVPPGDRGAWQSDPFTPSVRGENLHGRGCADMKSGLSAMVAAASAWVAESPEFSGRIGFLITSDEEGLATDGTVKVLETLAARGEKIDYAVVGEASSEKRLGDRLVIGRRGSLNGLVTVQGRQCHIAYPQNGDNPIHRLAPVLAELVAKQWDQGNEHFPATSFQVSNLNGGVGADNVIPDTATLQFNFRFSTESTAEQLQEGVLEILNRHPIDYEIRWRLSGHPFMTPEGTLTNTVCDAIESQTGQRPVLFTGGGTSDARFIAPAGAEVVELGPVGRTAHKIDEEVRIEDLGSLAAIYLEILRRLLG